MKQLAAIAAIALACMQAFCQIQTPNTGGSGSGGGSGIVTNANQFGASTTLTIKDTPLITNLWVYGSTTTQTIKSQDGSGTDKAGATFQIRGGQSTGSGIGGALAHHTSLTGGSGSSLNSYSTRGYAYAGEKSITDAISTGVADITIASGNYVGCDLLITYKAANGFGDWSVNTVRINLSAYNDSGTISAAYSTQQASVIHSFVGSETIGFSTSSPSAGVIRILTTFTSDTWSEPPNIKCKWQLLINSDDVATVTPI